MASAVLDVREIPDLLVTKFHSYMFSWYEENGTVVFHPANSVPGIKDLRGTLKVSDWSDVRDESDNELFGIWKGRDDMSDPSQYVRQIRKARTLC